MLIDKFTSNVVAFLRQHCEIFLAYGTIPIELHLIHGKQHQRSSVIFARLAQKFKPTIQILRTM
ncbi:hypothetical protein OX89_04210 [Diaphorobacter sp. J5-51]|nr:hypothetical protein OX89_04210 [Diaphorobacter sp. J5-51]